MLTRRQLLVITGAAVASPSSFRLEANGIIATSHPENLLQKASNVNPISSHDNPTNQVTFEALWKNHPMGDDKKKGDRWPCSNLLHLDCLNDGIYDITRDQCAVRLGVCLRKTFKGLSFEELPRILREDGENKFERPMVCGDISKGTCAHDHNEFHILKSKELARVFLHVTANENKSSFPDFEWLQKAERYCKNTGTLNDFRNIIGSRRGIIFVEDFWRKKNGKSAGSHVDLYDGRLRRTKNELYYLGRNGPPNLKFERNSREVLFWEVP